MIVDRVLVKLAEIERAVGSETPARVRGMAMDAEDAVLEIQRETLRLMRELELAQSRRVALPEWEAGSEERLPAAAEPERWRLSRVGKSPAGMERAQANYGGEGIAPGFDGGDAASPAFSEERGIHKVKRAPSPG